MADKVSSSSSSSSSQGGICTHDCDVCRYDGDQAAGIALCVSCRNYLCEGCLSDHTEHKLSKDHHILEGEEINNVAMSADTPTVKYFCDGHKNKKLEFYCKVHDKVICSVCKDTEHSSCQDVDSISDAASRGNWARQADHELELIEKLIREFQIALKARQSGYTEFKKQKYQCRQEIKELHEKLNRVFTELELEMHAELDDVDDDATSSLSHLQTVSEDSIKALEDEASVIRSVKLTADDSKIFIAAKTSARTELFQVMQTFIKDDTAIVGVTFEPRVALRDILNKHHQIGNLTVSRSVVGQGITAEAYHGHTHTTAHNDRKAVKTGEFTVREPSDDKVCSVEGARFLDDGRLVLIDHNNKKLKMLDENFLVVSSISLKCRPVDISLTGPTDAVVTYSINCKLQFVKLAPKLQLSREATTRLHCRGVVCVNDKLYLSCMEGGNVAVLVLDLQGQEENTIRTGVAGGYPHYIAADTRGCLYISDTLRHFVLCITLQGHVVYRCSDVGLQSPQSLLLDPANNVLVCGQHSHNVQMIDDTGTKYLDLIPSGEEGIVLPSALAERKTDGTLVVGMYENDNICVFSLIEGGLTPAYNNMENYEVL